MANLQGINKAATLVPYSTDDIHAIAHQKHVRGGWHSGYQSLAERDAIFLDRREWSMVVCLLDGTKWELVKGYSSENLADNANWKPYVVASSGSTSPATITLYSSTGNSEDGAMTQKATTTAVNSLKLEIDTTKADLNDAKSDILTIENQLDDFVLKVDGSRLMTQAEADKLADLQNYTLQNNSVAEIHLTQPVRDKLNAVVAGSGYDDTTLKSQIGNLETRAGNLETRATDLEDGKVNRQDGYGLTQVNFSPADKSKLDNLQQGITELPKFPVRFNGVLDANLTGVLPIGTTDIQSLHMPHGYTLEPGQEYTINLEVSPPTFTVINSPSAVVGDRYFGVATFWPTEPSENNNNTSFNSESWGGGELGVITLKTI